MARTSDHRVVLWIIYVEMSIELGSILPYPDDGEKER